MRKKSVQPDKAGRYAGVEVDPETSKRKPTEGKGTGAVNPAPGLDACLLHEDDSDQDACLFLLPMVDESNDSPEDLMALSRQMLFDTGAAVSVPNDVQTRCSNRAIRRNPTASSERHESCSLPQHGCWYSKKIEGRLDVRNVTKPIVAAGQVTDRGQGEWLNGDGGVHRGCQVCKHI